MQSQALEIIVGGEEESSHNVTYFTLKLKANKNCEQRKSVQ